MSAGIVAYSARVDATPEREREALGLVYGFVLSSHAKRKATESNVEEGAKAEPNDASQEGRAEVEEAKV